MILIGDLHKSFNLIRNYISEKELKNESFIQLGDIGVATDKDYLQLKNLNIFLKFNNNHLYCVLGKSRQSLLL